MPHATHPTREILLDAGVRLAERKSLLDTSVDEIVRQAKVAKGTFYVHFADRTAFVVALHRRFYDELNAAIDAAVEGLPPGAERLQRGALAYLDGCLRSKAVKAVLLEASTVADIAHEVTARSTYAAARAARDFKAMGSVPAEGSARLFVAMVSEVALAELANRGPDKALRAALWKLAGLAPRRR